jgi:hypothetical protein
MSLSIKMYRLIGSLIGNVNLQAVLGDFVGGIVNGTYEKLSTESADWGNDIRDDAVFKFALLMVRTTTHNAKEGFHRERVLGVADNIFSFKMISTNLNHHNWH